MKEWFVYAESVARALAARRPVVALETTVVTHGLPHPDGVEAALALEHDVTEHGATPATIGIFDGTIRVGVTRADLERLATSPGVSKLNLSNLAAIIASGGLGSTTVAATMFAAERSGIPVFATGGIGGVHRGSEVTGDISADLDALANHPVIVVSAGAKAFLDLARTLEYLETLGVPVLGWQTNDFPAFYSRSSGVCVPHRVESASEVAAIFAARSRPNTGILIANPIPLAAEIPAADIENVLAAAEHDAAAAGITGNKVTPFILGRIADATAGRSIPANLALAENNAVIAALVAAQTRLTP